MTSGGNITLVVFIQGYCTHSCQYFTWEGMQADMGSHCSHTQGDHSHHPGAGFHLTLEIKYINYCKITSQTGLWGSGFGFGGFLKIELIMVASVPSVWL